MGLLSAEVEMTITSRNATYYENLGYKIPRRINKYKRVVIAVGEKIRVNVCDLPKYSNVKVLVECDCCKKSRILKYCDYLKNLKPNGENYCLHCSLTIINSGENHYLWNPNITEEERIFGRRTIRGYTEFIKAVLHRDNFTCFCCGVHLDNLQVHHLDGYDWCVEKRCEISNGVALCENCHKNFHLIYGRGNNTKEQFEEWIGKSIELLNEYNGELPTAREIYCIEEDKIYKNTQQFCDEHGLKSLSAIHKTCNNALILSKTTEQEVVPTSISHMPKTIKGLHILWFNDYKHMSDDDIERYLKNTESKQLRTPIIRLDTLEVFNSIYMCSEKYKINIETIKKYCSNLKPYKRRGSGEVFRFMYYEDYLKENDI